MNLLDDVEDNAKLHPRAIAVRAPRNDITFSDLNLGLWSGVANLVDFGIVAGDRVGLSIVNKVHHLMVSLALARIGASHFAFPLGSNEADLGDLALKLGLRAIVLDEDRDTGLCRKIMLKEFRRKQLGSEEKVDLRSYDGELPWLILQSSGTTGEPKYSVLTHNQMQSRAMQSKEYFGFDLGQKIWCSPDISYVMTKTRTMTSLKAAMTSCFVPNQTPIKQVVHLLNREKVDFGYVTAFDLQALISVGVQLPTFRAIEATSGNVSMESRELFMRTVNENLVICYATNEAGAISWHKAHLRGNSNNAVGKVAPGLEVEIVDRSNNPVETGVIGHLRVKGPGVISGYISSPEANNAAFRSGWFYPGDMGSLSSDGQLSFHGRVDDLMIFNGINIYPAEIEDALSAHDAVVDSCAFGIGHQVHQDVPVAAVVSKNLASEKELLEHCRRLLGPKSPKRIFFVDSIPRTSNGKPLRRELIFLAKEKLT